jgi:hypothetical protein
MSLAVGDPIDKAGRKRLAKLLQAVAGDMSERGSQLASERILVLAPLGEVTADLVAFVDKVIALAVSRCPRCLDPSVGMCNPCRAPHAREHSAAARGVPFVLEPIREPAPAPPSGNEWAGTWSADEPERDPLDAAMAHCTHKTRYSTDKIARQVAARCFEERGHHVVPYACLAGCGGFHLRRGGAA